MVFRTALPCLALVLAAAALRIHGMDAGLGDHDTWRQLETASIARNFLDEPSILWPRVNWGEPGPGYVEAEFQLFPWVVHVLYRVCGEDAWLGRALSVLFFALSCWPFHRLASRWLGARGVVFAMALYCFAPILFRFTRTFMPEATVVLMAMVALERFVAWVDSGRRAQLLASAVAMALAILVKPTSIHLGLVLAVLAAWRHGTSFLRRGDLWLFAAIALLPGAAWYAHAAAIHAAHGNTFGVISGGDSKWGNMAWWTSLQFHKDLVTMEVARGSGRIGALFCLLGLPLFAVAGTRASFRPAAWAWMAATAIYYLAAARYCGHPDRGLHYHVYAVPLLALLAGNGFERACRGRVLTILACLAGLAAVAELVRIDLHVKSLRHPATTRTCGERLAALAAPGDRVLVLSPDDAVDRSMGEPVANNFEQPDVFFHARRKGRLLARDRQTAAHLDAELERFQPRWYVHRPGSAQPGEPGAVFRAALEERFALRASGDDWEIWEIRSR